MASSTGALYISPAHSRHNLATQLAFNSSLARVVSPMKLPWFDVGHVCRVRVSAFREIAESVGKFADELGARL